MVFKYLACYEITKAQKHSIAHTANAYPAFVLMVIIYTETFWKTNEQGNKIKNSQHYS